jgi:hypothetical protein
VCSFCLTSQPLAALRHVADGLQCADAVACSQRAEASGIYPMDENELETAAREMPLGVVRA